MCHGLGRQLQFLVSPSKGPILTYRGHRTLGVLAVQPSLWPYVCQVAWKQVPLGWLWELSMPWSEPVCSLSVFIYPSSLANNPMCRCVFILAGCTSTWGWPPHFKQTRPDLSPVLFKIHLVFVFWADKIIVFVFSADEVLPHPHAFCKNHTS